MSPVIVSEPLICKVTVGCWNQASVRIGHLGASDDSGLDSCHRCAATATIDVLTSSRHGRGVKTTRIEVKS